MQEFKRKYMVLGQKLNNFKQRINDIMKIIQALEDCNILLKGVTKTIKNEKKKKKKNKTEDS